MYQNHKPKNNHRKVIEQYASEQELYRIIEDEIRKIYPKSKSLPQHINQLPENHFIIQLLEDSNLHHKFRILEPFVSPIDLMKAYNRKHSQNNFYAVEIYYYYDPDFDNKKLEDYSDPKDFYFILKNLYVFTYMSSLSEKIQTLMQVYLNKHKEVINDTIRYQTSYVVPKGYYPVISMKIKYDFTHAGQRKTGFQYLILRFDEHQIFKNNPIKKMLTQNNRKNKLKISIQRKKNQKALRVQPQQISKKQQLKSTYTLENVSFGWLEVQQSQFEKKEHFHTHFDIITLEDNIKYAQNRKNPNFRTKTYLSVKKGEFQIPRIEIISFLFEQLVLKCVIKLNDIKKVSFFKQNKFREIYLHVSRNPQFYLHLLDKNVANNLFNLTPWERIQNFSLDFQSTLGNSHFMRNFLSQNSVICIDFQTGKQEFEKLVRFFSAQEIIQSQFIYEHSFDKVEKKFDNLTLKLQNIFNQILKDTKDELRIKVHQIKFSLLSLKNLQKTKITFEDMINLLKQIENANLQVVEKHNKALKLLCSKPHQLLSKPFTDVYQKFLKQQDLFEKVKQRFPNMELYQFMKLGQALEMDSLSEVSDIESISQISDDEIDFLNDFFTSIQKTKLVLLPRIRLTPNGIVYNGWSLQVASKILKHYKDYEYQFLKCQVCDDQGKKIHNSPYIQQVYIRNMMDKIKIIDEEYVPLGWSQSQLKQGALWYTLESTNIKTKSRDEILQFMGDFDDKKLTNPALKAARIGQNFGSSWSFNATEIKFIEQQDICVQNNQQKMFSDGIGCISQYNMLKFRQGLGLDSLAAVQVRYKGVKGVLSLNKQLSDNTAILRKSQIKYQCNNPESVKYFDIIDYSKYKVGYLNRQVIILLIANKILQHHIIALQTQYIKLLEKDIFEILFENICFDDEEEMLFQKQIYKKFQSVTEVFKMILSKTYQDKNNSINQLVFQQTFFKALKVQAKRRLLSKLREKCRIRVDKSVRIFGILDQFKVLNEYQVYCSILKPTEKQKQNITGKCMLTKNPCMHPADIRVVTCVSDEEIQKRLKQKGKNPYLFEDLVNVIVFPQKGKTPLTMEISQSDLDGDQFLLCWDQRIVPYKNLDPFVIAEEVPFIERQWTGSGFKEMLDFFVQYQNHNKLGRLANSHLIQADLNGAFCKECVQLCKTHSVAVQYPKRGYDFKIDDDLLFHMYPHYMQKQHPLKSYRSKSILGKLYDAVLKESNIKGYDNQRVILEGKKQEFWSLTQIYLNLEEMNELKMKSIKNIQVNKIIEKYEDLQDQQIQDIDNPVNQKEQNQEPVPYANVKKQYQIEDKEFYKKKKLPFSMQSLNRLLKFLQTSQNSKKYDLDQPFSLAEILTTFNYLCVYYYELKYLSELLENEHESIYTIYFELQTSSKNKNNLFLLERINEFRLKWLRFFGEELVNDGCFKSVEQFQKFYFDGLIEKKPDFQDSSKKVQKSKEFSQKKRLIKKMMNEIVENESSKAQFIMDEMENLKIIKKSLQYDTYRYIPLGDISPLVYRKLVLFYVVSNYFREVVDLYNVKNLILNDYLYLSGQEGKKIRGFLQFGELNKALKFYDENQIDFLGFSWFCLPKLMVVWWRDIFKEEETKIITKNKEKQKSQQSKPSTQPSSTKNFSLPKGNKNPSIVKPFSKKSTTSSNELMDFKDLIDDKKCEIY